MSVSRFVATSSLLLVAGCGEPPPRTAQVDAGAPSAEAGCGEVCAELARCGPGPGCEARCGRDVEAMRAGFEASFAGCLRGELATKGCGDGGRAFAERRAEACYFATVEAYAARAPDAALEPIVTASCARERRCGADVGSDCAGALRERLRTRAGAALLRALEPVVIDALGGCLVDAPCEDRDALARCVSAARAARGARP